MANKLKVEFVDNSASQYDDSAALIPLGRSLKGKLFVGDQASSSFLQLRARKCQAVVCCSEDLFGYCKEKEVTYYKIEPTEAKEKEWDRCIDFIHERVTKGETVLLFCDSGRTRSILVLLAYLMKIHSFSLTVGYSLCEKARGTVKLSPSMARLLLGKEKALLNKNTMVLEGKTLISLTSSESTNNDLKGEVSTGEEKTKKESTHPLVIGGTVGIFCVALYAFLYAIAGKM